MRYARIARGLVLDRSMLEETLADHVLQTEGGRAYRRFDEVGVGGFGTVYFGRDQATNRPVAIKRLHAHFASDQKVVQRFEREARLARSLTHPNVVRVLDQGRDSMGVPFLVLEWVDGWTLAHQLERRRQLPIGEAVEIACQALAGLAAAHERGIVHRDIKPANLMVTPDGNVKVMDFGIAREGDSSTTGSIGTLPYMAPEQFGDQHLDGRTDLYALGATLFEALAGRRPFQGPTATAYLRQHLQETPPTLDSLRPELPPKLGDVVLRALAKEPADRYQTADEMRSHLSPFAAAQLTSTVPVQESALPPTEVEPAVVTPAPPPVTPAPPTPRVVPPPPPATAAVSSAPPTAFLVGSGVLFLLIVVFGLALAQVGPFAPGTPTPQPTAIPTALPTRQPAQPTQAPVAKPTVAPVARPTSPPPTATAVPVAPVVPPRNYANELTDWGIPVQKVLQSQVGSRTPLNIPGGKVITTSELATAIRAGVDFLLVDALKDDHLETIVGAERIPDAGSYGNFNDATQRSLARQLADLSDGDFTYDIVFFCQGAECWESYNASLRAINLGYTNVFWYRGGLASWKEAGLPMAP